jgi:beta-mannosidase
MGLDPALTRGPLYGQLLPRLVAAAGIDAPYVPSSPWGGELPFRPGAGIAHYFGVGAYLRPLEDARRAEVRFASECLAVANVPDDDALPAGEVHGAAWKAGTPRDAGAGWDFDDVRDHYLKRLYGVDPAALRYADPARYLDLSRGVSGELMAETFGEWRRAGSPCDGALVLWLKDLVPGAGWGLLDHRGVPKVALHHLRRVLAPLAVWTTDEGLNGIAIHIANDGPAACGARLRVSLYRDGATRVAEEVRDVSIGAHGSWQTSVEAVLGHFADVGWAYRFGPPAQDLIAVVLEDAAGAPLARGFRFPVGRPAPRTASALGLRAQLALDAEDHATVTVAADGVLDGVRIELPGWRAEDDAFVVEPGRPYAVTLRRAAPAADLGPEPRGRLRALNLTGVAHLSL